MPLTDPSTAGALRELVARGLIAAEPAAQPLSEGNTDRREAPPRTSWRVNLPDGRTARLVLGPDLADMARRQTAFARACPTLLPAPIFQVKLADGQAFADEFFEGVSLESIVERSPEQARAILAKVHATLAATQRPSTEAARLAEWQAWTKSVEGLPRWTADEKKLLREQVWPGLYPLLCLAAPATRWTNGDFTTANILLNPAGAVRVIDCEFAGETHFFAEDGARFYTFSPSARRQPGLFSDSLPRSGPAWHLYFWLRQVAMEVTHNSDAYLARMRTTRLGVIRRLAEVVLDCRLDTWSVAATPLHHAWEATHWDHSSALALHMAGWCHVPEALLSSVVVTQGDTLLAESAGPASRADVQAHFGGAPLALVSGFTLSVRILKPVPPVVISAVTYDGQWLPLQQIRPDDVPGHGPWQENYADWAAQHDPDPPAPTGEASGPLFSLLLPVYNPPVAFLRACLDSVRRQHPASWELCVVDDASTSPGVHEHLAQAAAADPRIRLQRRPQNGGIARATNDALAAARGDFILLLDHDDELRPHALREFAQRLEREPDLDALYSDEDKITAEGGRVVPFLKPDFSPELLLGVMYIGHALCVRTSIARAAGGFDPAYDGVQDYEFFLRVTEHTRRIAHVPRMLYHWRQSAGSSALQGNVKGDMDRKQQAAVRAHLQRIGRADEVLPLGRHRLRLISSRRPTVELLRLAITDDPVAVLRQAAARGQAEVLVLLTEGAAEADGAGVQNAAWVDDLAGVAVRADSALVAPLILFPNGWVRESGWTVNPVGAAPLLRGFAADLDGYNGSLPCTREVVAVSPLCIAVRRTLAHALLTNGPQGERWVDFCLRAVEEGKVRGKGGEQEETEGGRRYHRVCPAARITVPEAVPDALKPGDTATSPDPFYNPHFAPRRGDYTLS